MLQALLKKYQHIFHQVVPFNPGKDKLVLMDFTASNTALTDSVINYTPSFTHYINNFLAQHRALYGIGGYMEERILYKRSTHFNGSSAEEPRRIHLGVDVWGKAGIPIFAPLGGMVHSIGYNDTFGDYGATIILLHQLEGYSFHTLYGHLSKNSADALKEGSYVNIGQHFADFGIPEENGQWPPHLHLQVIIDMELHKGDYPGVCSASDKKKYTNNCPDPDLILNMIQFADKT